MEIDDDAFFELNLRGKAIMQFLSSIQREIISQSEILSNKFFYNFSNVKAYQGISNPTAQFKTQIHQTQ